MGFQFQYFYFIWLLGGLFILFVLFLSLKRWKRITRRKIGDPALVKEMITRYSPRRFSFKFLLICLAFSFGVLAVMSLRKPSGNDGIQRKGIDVVFALDLSGSMLATDIAPNRLEKAKQFISQMIAAMPGNRIGLVWFAGKAFVQMPISSDHSAAQMFVENASPDIIPAKGTVIGDALEESLKAFGERDAKYKAVILISDGEDHDIKAIQLSKDLSLRGLMVNTVGIGSPQGTYLIDDSIGGNKKDPETGKEIISKLNETELKQIAGNTNGVYVRLNKIDDAIKKINASFSHIDKKVTGDIGLMDFSYYYWIFAGLMCILLILEHLLPEEKRG
ncbi:MAG: VWA domain-containing protein [Sphingobacteriales bacterium]|jgi:Ca-activated chloride channel family protein|nr:VWA domain-containing protein [Sphingobacteriales bacterium]